MLSYPQYLLKPIKKNSTPLGTSTFRSKLSRQSMYGAALRFGYKVAPCWVAGVKLGYERATYKTKVDLSTNTAGVISNMNIINKKLKHNGFVPGIYAEKLLNKHWMVGAEYGFGMYKKKTAVDSFGNKHTYKPHSHDFKIRFGYKF